MEKTDVEVEFEKRKRALLPLYEVLVHLPKFKIESSHDLPEVLRDLGMEKMFDRQRADFTDMVDPSRVQGVLHVDSVSHNLRYESSTLILYKELSSSIFQSLSVTKSVSQALVAPP